MPQDVFKVDFVKNNPALYKASLDAIEASAKIYLQTSAVVIIEGVFSKKHWEDLIHRLSDGVECYSIFLETSVETSVSRAGGRSKAAQISEADVRLWHPKSVPLGSSDELVLSADGRTVQELAEQIAIKAGIAFDVSQTKAKFYSDSFHPAVSE